MNDQCVFDVGCLINPVIKKINKQRENWQHVLKRDTNNIWVIIFLLLLEIIAHVLQILLEHMLSIFSFVPNLFIFCFIIETNAIYFEDKVTNLPLKRI